MMDLKITEAHMQAVMMRYVMNTMQHQLVVPNSNQFFSWEADLLSVTRARLIHEFEIKISKADYRRDENKFKHYYIGNPAHRGPSYFWYVTFEFDIEPPEKAGWIRINREGAGSWYKFYVTIKKDAPRLSAAKLDDDHQWQISRLLSWRLSNLYEKKYLHEYAGDNE